MVSQQDAAVARLQAEGSQTERQQLKTLSKEGHVCVLPNPGNPPFRILELLL